MRILLLPDHLTHPDISASQLMVDPLSASGKRVKKEK
jgi:hypothetical protein